MSEEPTPQAAGVLAGVRVVDWTSQDGAYATRLLADLGADVVRLETGSDDRLWPEEPIGVAGVVVASGFERFVNLNKRSVWIDAETLPGREVMAQLFAKADVVVTSGEADHEWREANRGDLAPYGPKAVHLNVSGFGSYGPGAAMTSDDLVALASGGLLSLGGYPDAGPVAVYGNQTYLAGGISTAIAALLALIGRRTGVEVHDIDVSTQAVIASALEDAPAEYDLTGSVRYASGDQPREAGTGTFAASDGWIAIVAGKLGTAKAWDTLVAWLIEEGALGAGPLAGAEWKTLVHRRLPDSIATFRSIFETFLSSWNRQDFYEAAQSRGISVAPVNSLPDLLEDIQLADRGFFRDVEDGVLGRQVTYPGPPYRLPDHPPMSWSAAPAPGCDGLAVLRGWLDLDEARLADLAQAGAIR
jgi:benzylsuccinate CoA-transferase BbsE subunit